VSEIAKYGAIMSKPVIHTNPMYQLLRQEDIAAFNLRRDKGESAELTCGDFRGLDLRNLNADGLDFSDGYFRGADLRGIDFRKAKLEGASLCEAKISGCYFPHELTAEEIRLSVEGGIRMRYK
jgi:uncharacterized protein YjbI with pentapeptide repeats